MSRYFSQERCLQEVKAYIERAETHMENDDYYEAQFDGFEELQDDLFNLETIDIVRCKNCIWARPRTLKGETGYRCIFYCTDKAENGYCDVGEREGE